MGLFGKKKDAAKEAAPRASAVDPSRPQQPELDGLINEMLTMSCEAMKEVAEDDEKMDECAAPPLFLGHAHSSPPRPQRCPAHSSPPRP